MMGRGLMKFLDREPVAAVSIAIGVFGFCIPLVVPPVREAMGLSTKQSNPTAELPKPRLAPGSSS